MFFDAIENFLQALWSQIIVIPLDGGLSYLYNILNLVLQLFGFLAGRGG